MKEAEVMKVVFGLKNSIKFGFGFGIGMFVWGVILGIIFTLIMMGIIGAAFMPR